MKFLTTRQWETLVNRVARLDTELIECQRDYDSSVARTNRLCRRIETLEETNKLLLKRLGLELVENAEPVRFSLKNVPMEPPQ